MKPKAAGQRPPRSGRVAFTTKVQPVTLTASDVKATTATLTIANHSGDWHYKHTTPTGGQCSAAVSGTVANLTGLTANTDYVFAAYSDGGCATGLGVQVGFRTKPETSGTTTTPTTTTDTTTDTTEPKVEPVEQPDPEPVATAPPAPSRPTAVAGNARVTLRWRSNGGRRLGHHQMAVRRCNRRRVRQLELTWPAAAPRPPNTWSRPSPTASCIGSRCVPLTPSGEGEESSASDGVTPATTPAAPSQPLATFGNGQVRLDWRSNGDGGSAITGWQYVQASDGGFGDWIDVADAGADTTSHVVEGLVNGTAYRFKVRAVNALGKGDESPETALATPATVALAPTKPEVLSGNAQVSISWRSNGDGGRPILRWEYAIGSGGGYGHWEEIPGSGVATTEHVATGLANGTAYRFKVRAATALGAGEESPESESVVPADYAIGAVWAGGCGELVGLHAHVDLERGRRLRHHGMAIRLSERWPVQRMDGHSGQRAGHDELHGSGACEGDGVSVQGARRECAGRGRGIGRFERRDVAGRAPGVCRHWRCGPHFAAQRTHRSGAVAGGVGR